MTQGEHYRQGDVECIDALRSALGHDGFASFCQGNIIKYSWRYKHKGGKADLIKAQQYMTWLQEVHDVVA